MSRVRYSESWAARRRPLDKAEEETAACVVEAQDLRAATCEEGMGEWKLNFCYRQQRDAGGARLR